MHILYYYKKPKAKNVVEDVYHCVTQHACSPDTIMKFMHELTMLSGFNKIEL